jgi:hypothetical protein
LDSRSPGIEENAILNDRNSVADHISYPRNENDLWTDLCLERLFEEEEETSNSNRTLNNSIENNLIENGLSISNESNSIIDDNECLIEPSNNSSISELTTENVIDNLPTEQIEPNINYINIGVQLAEEGPWHAFSANRLLNWLMEHIDDVTPLQIQIIFGLITTGTLLNLYFRSMGPCPFFDLMRPDARSINYINRAERMTNIRSPRLLRQIWPRFPQFVMRISRRTLSSFVLYNVTFFGGLLTITVIMNRLNSLFRNMRDYMDKNKKNFVPLIFTAIEPISQVFDWINGVAVGNFFVLYGIMLLISGLYVLFELILLIYIYNFDYFNIESKKNKYVKRYLNMMNELFDEPGSFNYLMGLIEFAMKGSFLFIFSGYIMLFFNI